MSAANNHEVIVTAGGTREKVDGIRWVGRQGDDPFVISNFSGGEFGHALASEYAQLGHSVLLLAPQSVVDRFGKIDGVDHEKFFTADDLRRKLLEQASAKLIFQAAAVSDYAPEAVKGKISSDQESITIRLSKTQKILPLLREHFGTEAQLIGFKLLDSEDKAGLTEADKEGLLIEAALGQLAVCKTDFCIANDLVHINSDERTRRIHIVESGGEYHTIDGRTEEVAAEIASRIIL